MLKTKVYNWAAPVISGILAGMLSFSFSAFAQTGPSNLNVSGFLLQPGGTPVTGSVNFKLEVLDKNGTCVLYSEEHLAQDLSTTRGGFGLQVGDGSSKSNKIDAGSATALSSKVFLNSGAVAPFAGCAGGVNLNAGDNRVLRVWYDTGSGYIPMSPDVPMLSSAYAMIADSLQGKTPSNFVQVRDDATYDLNQANVESIFSATNFAKLTAILSGNVSNQRLTNVTDPSAASDAATKNYSDNNVGGKVIDFSGVGPAIGNGKTIVWDQAQNKWVTGTPSATDATKLPLAGGTMTGAIAMGGQNITNIGHMTMATQRTLNLGTYTDPQETTLVAGLGAADKGKIWFNTTSNTFKVWDGTVAAGAGGSSGAAGGDLTGTYPNPTIANSAVATAKIANDAVTSAKISNTGIAVNRLLITDAATGGSVTYATCAVGEVLKYGATGWACSTAAALLGNSGVTAATYGSATQVAQVAVDAQGRITSASNVAITFPVVSVAGKTGAVTLSTSDVSGLGTAAGKNYGTSAGNLVELDGSAKIPASLLPSSAGDIQDVVAGSGLTGGGSSGAVTISVDTGTTTGKIVQMAASDKLPAVDGSNLTNVNAIKIQSRSVAATAPGANEVLMWNNSTSVWEPKAVPSAPVTSVAAKTGAVTLDWSDVANAATKYLGYRPNNVACSDGEVLKWNNSASYWACGSDIGGSGFVTHVGSGTGLTGGPITSTGTLAVDVGVTTGKIIQVAASNKLPVIDGSNLTNINAVQLQAKNVSSTAPTANQVLKWNNGTSFWEPAAETDAFTGTVTSVVSGSGLTGGNITSTGTLAVDVGVTTGKILQMAASDKLPAVDGSNLTNINAVQLQAKNVSSTAPTANQVLKWNNGTSVWEPAAETDAFSGTVTSVVSGSGLTGGNITSTGTLAVDVGVTTGKIVQMAASDKLPAVDGSNLTNINAVQLQSKSVSSTAPTANQVLKWNNGTSVWEPAAETDAFAGTVTSVVSGTGLTGGNITGTGTLAVDVGTTTGKIVQMAASDKLPAVDGSNLTNVNAIQLRGKTVSTTAPSASGQILTWNNGTSVWEPASPAAAASVLASAGTVGAPSISFSADPDTGWWRPAADTLAASTAGLERARIDANGNMGIGTTSPLSGVGTILNIYNSANTGTSASNASAIIESVNRNASVQLRSPAGATSSYQFVSSGGSFLGDVFYDVTNNAIGIRTNGANERMRIDSSGNVGIGTTSASSTLVVNGATRNLASVANTAGPINFATGNLQHTTNSCATFALHNLKDGGSYTFIIKGTTSATCVFNAYSDAGTTSLTVHMPPGHTTTTGTKHTIYNLLVSGTDLYVAWVPGY